MIAAPIPLDEPVRLDTLRSLDLLDTAPEERFDRLTRLARRLFNVPIALVSLVDENRQWFKSCVGLLATETPRDISFCGHAIHGDDIFVIPDALFDVRFHDNPLVTSPPHVRFYAGCPLAAPNGSKLGTLCLIDPKPRAFSVDDGESLRDLAHMAEREIAAVHLATIDELTRLSNRRGFEAQAQQALSMCLRLGKPAAMLFIDLDGFKQINDGFGHAEGDRALTSFATVMRQTFRSSDVVGRLGGDEFAVLMANCPEPSVTLVCRRLQQALQRHNETHGRGYDIRFSVGIAHADLDKPCSIAEMLARADALMYERKRSRSS